MFVVGCWGLQAKKTKQNVKKKQTQTHQKNCTYKRKSNSKKTIQKHKHKPTKENRLIFVFLFFFIDFINVCMFSGFFVVVASSECNIFVVKFVFV